MAQILANLQFGTLLRSVVLVAYHKSKQELVAVMAED